MSGVMRILDSITWGQKEDYQILRNKCEQSNIMQCKQSKQ